MNTKIYHPKGSMCMNCTKANEDCTNLNFKEMPVIKQYSKENENIVFKVVKCLSFDRTNDRDC